MGDGAPDFGKLDAVQELLDRNKGIILQIKENHDENTPESLAKNCTLIKELNGNIAKVVELYKDIASGFEEFMERHGQGEGQQEEAQQGEPPNG